MTAIEEHVTFAEGAITELPRIVRELGPGRVLLVCGRRSFEASGASRVLPDLQDVASVHRWSEFAPNTDADDLARGLALVEQVDPDLVLGVGGGSAMDMAKLLAGYHGKATPSTVQDAIRAGDRIESRAPQLVLTPTTAGSGAETTHFAVVYIGHDKHSIAGPALLPDRIVLDPSLMSSGSAYQRASSGLDALCHAIESLWAVDATDDSRRDARTAMPILLDHLETFVADPCPASARGMSLGSHLAGRAIDVSKTTAAHALSYGITKRHGLSHGHAVGVTLGPFLAVHAEAATERLRPSVTPEEHAMLVREIFDAFGATSGDDAHARFRRLMERIDLDPQLCNDRSDAAEEFRVLAATVNTRRLGNDPLTFTTDQLIEVLQPAG